LLEVVIDFGRKQPEVARRQFPQALLGVVQLPDAGGEFVSI
jgi:hypothetical protein